jgi:hypothetical protein
MSEVTFEVDPTTVQWGYDDTTYRSGTPHTVEADGDFAAALAAAHAAGAIRIKEGVNSLPSDHIETDKQSLAFRSKIDGLRAELQPQRDRHINEVQRSLLERVGDSDDDYGLPELAQDLQTAGVEFDDEMIRGEAEAIRYGGSE